MIIRFLKSVWGKGVFALFLVLVLGIGLLLLPIWDLRSFSVEGFERTEVAAVPEASELWDRLDALRELYDILEYDQRFEWEREPEEHREAIAEWLEATEGMETELMEVLDAYPLAYPPPDYEEFDISEISTLMEVARLLNMRLRFHVDVAEALKTFEIMQALCEEVQKADPYYLIDALVGLAVTTYNQLGTKYMMHQFSEVLSEDGMQKLAIGLPETGSLSPEYWVRAVEGEMLYFRSSFPRDVFPEDLLFWEETPKWIPRWNSFFFQPNRTLALQYEVMKLNVSLFLEHEMESKWTSLEAIEAHLANLEENRFLGLHNYYGRHGVFVYNLHPRFLQGLALKRMSKTIVALHRYRRAHGALPDGLMDLVPEFMDAVPVDPFDGEALRYDPERGIVYSVNQDRIDQGGDESGGRRPEQGLDYVMSIDGPT